MSCPDAEVPPGVVLRRRLRGAGEEHDEQRAECELLEGQAPALAPVARRRPGASGARGSAMTSMR